MSFVLSFLGGDGAGTPPRRDPAPQQVRFTWRHCWKRTWLHLAVALLIFVLGLGISMYLHIVLGRW
jgi:hypothetical protein